MASASTTIFYGGFVKSLHLCAAAEAWPHVKGALLALDLISRRRSTAKLEGEAGKSKSVTKIPVEVWSEIKRMCVSVALDEAYQVLAEQIQCPSCSETARVSPDGISFDESACTSDFCCAGGYEPYVDERDETLNMFLAAYGLQRPFSHVHPLSARYDDNEDSLCALAWSRPAVALPELDVDTRLSPHNSRGRAEAVLPIDASAFSLPPGLDAHLRAFSHLFQLPFFDIHPRPSSSLDQQTTARQLLAVPARPSWQLYTATSKTH
ncbi:hypothetical protein JCM10207_003724 [Rhodosporidiobolus poonsookiae]